jgi:hypothetical protein
MVMKRNNKKIRRVCFLFVLIVFGRPANAAENDTAEELAPQVVMELHSGHNIIFKQSSTECVENEKTINAQTYEKNFIARKIQIIALSWCNNTNYINKFGKWSNTDSAFRKIVVDTTEFSTQRENSLEKSYSDLRGVCKNKISVSNIPFGVLLECDKFKTAWLHYSFRTMIQDVYLKSKNIYYTNYAIKQFISYPSFLPEHTELIPCVDMSTPPPATRTESQLWLDACKFHSTLIISKLVTERLEKDNYEQSGDMKLYHRHLEGILFQAQLSIAGAPSQNATSRVQALLKIGKQHNQIELLTKELIISRMNKVFQCHNLTMIGREIAVGKLIENISQNNKQQAPKTKKTEFISEDCSQVSKFPDKRQCKDFTCYQ